MKHRLAEILVCPACGGPLQLVETERRGEEIMAGTLSCTPCRRDFPIREGVPRMLLDDAAAHTPILYEAQWKHRLAGRFERKKILYFQDLEKLVRWWFGTALGPVSPGEWMWDAGCGTGEKALIAAQQNPDLQVVGLDIVDSVVTAGQQAVGVPNLHFIQGDLAHPPFRPGTFAKVVSWGVLHHMPDTGEAVREVRRLLKPGGRLLLWLYPHPDEDKVFSLYCYVRDRHFLGRAHRVPPRLLYWLVWIYCVCMMPIFYYGFRRYVIPQYKDCDYMVLSGLSVAERYRGVVFLVFDILAAETQSRHKRSEVLGWLRELGFEGAQTDLRGHYWGRQPAGGA